TIAAKALHTFVFMNVIVVGVEKIAVANDEIEHRIRIAVRLGGVTTEDVEYGPPVVTAGRNLTVAIVVGLTPRIRQPLHLEAVGRSDQPKIGISIAPADLKIQLGFAKARLEPVL